MKESVILSIARKAATSDAPSTIITQPKTVLHSFSLALCQIQQASSCTPREKKWLNLTHPVTASFMPPSNLGCSDKQKHEAVKGYYLCGDHWIPFIRTLLQREYLGEPNFPESVSNSHRGLGQLPGLLTRSPQLTEVKVEPLP